MKEEILEPNSSFLFDKLSMIPPTVILGGNHFIKFLYNGNPVYIQPPKCNIKQGISKAGKKFYSDLIFTNDNDSFIKWIEEIESFSQTQIFNNREKWFESELEMHDIENSFTSPLKIQKAGKQYILRSNIPARLGKCSLKIYDEHENDVDPETIKDNTDIMCILEIQGIRCSARNFQIEIEVKQMMTMEPSTLFEKCILAKSSLDIKYITNELEKVEKPKETKVEKPKETKVEKPKEIKVEKETKETKEENSLPIANDELVEFVVDLDSVETTDVMQIKKRNDVYYNMYREAKEKAKIARNLALSSYLEVKRIKNVYMLDDVTDSDDDDDADESVSVDDDDKSVDEINLEEEE